MTTENQTPNPEGGEPQQPSADDARLAEIDKELLDLTPEKISAMERGSLRQKAVERRAALWNEKGDLLIKPVLAADPDRPQEPGAEKPAEPAMKEPPKPAFELEIPDTLSPSQKETAAGFAEDVATIATEVGIPAEEAQVVLETAFDVALTIMPNGEEPNLANLEECMEVMNRRWGQEGTREIVADAQKAVEKLGVRVREWLDAPNEFGERLGNSPATIYALAAWQRGYTRMSPAKAAAEVERITKLDQYRRGEKRTIDHVNVLRKIAARTQSRELPMPSKGVPSSKTMARAEIDKRIKDLRANPAYLDKSHAAHKEVVQQVSDLYAQLGEA